MNTIIVEQFTKLVLLIQEQIEDASIEDDTKEMNKHSFRLRQIKAILTKIKKLDFQITLENVNKLLEIQGIGKGAITRITEILNTGCLSELDGFQKKNSGKKEILKDLQEIIGIGRKNALELMEKWKIKSVEELIERNKTGEIVLNDKILLGLKYHNVYQKNIPRQEIKDASKYMKYVIKKMNRKYKFTDENKLEIQICGSFRRGKPLSNDIDVLITKRGTLAKNKKEDAIYLNKFVDKLKKSRSKNNDQPFLIDDMTDKNSTYKYMGFSKYLDNPARRIDIIFIPYESYPCALLYFTGSKENSVIMRKQAKKMGLKLNENELYDSKTKSKINVSSEKDIFNKLNLEYLEPNQR